MTFLLCHSAAWAIVVVDGSRIYCLNWDTPEREQQHCEYLPSASKGSARSASGKKTQEYVSVLKLSHISRLTFFLTFSTQVCEKVFRPDISSLFLRKPGNLFMYPPTALFMDFSRLSRVCWYSANICRPTVTERSTNNFKGIIEFSAMR